MLFFKYCLTFIITLRLFPCVFGQTLEDFEAEFIKVIEKIQSCVVKIEVSYKDKEIPRSSSGIILDKEGYTITVANTVKNADRIKAYLPCGKQTTAQMVGIDCHTQLALLKLDTAPSFFIEKGTSERLRLGAFLIVIGNPYGLKNSVSTGIVSGLNRTVWMKGCPRPMTGLIQTTAPINPGDDGGLVVDSRGRFVGMAFSSMYRKLLPQDSAEFITKILFLLKEIRKDPGNRSRLQYNIEKIFQLLPHASQENSVDFVKAQDAFVSQGINFVLPAESVYWVAQHLKKQGKINRGWFGIKVKDTESRQGVVVIEISEQSPAAKTDLKIGDVLLSLNNTPISDSLSLLHQISFLLEGEEIQLVYKRNDELSYIKFPLALWSEKAEK